VPKSNNISDPNLIALLRRINQTKTPLYRVVAKKILAPRRQRPAVNLGTIERHTETGDTVVVPGKVLAAGKLEHNVTVAALSFSEQAQKQIENSNGVCLTIAELIEKNPGGTGIKLLT